MWCRSFVMGGCHSPDASLRLAWRPRLMLAARAATAGFAQSTAPQPACVGPAELVRLDLPLKRSRNGSPAALPLTIVAIGSSSTSGAGASSPANNYPSRLAVELQAALPARADHRA